MDTIKWRGTSVKNFNNPFQLIVFWPSVPKHSSLHLNQNSVWHFFDSITLIRANKRDSRIWLNSTWFIVFCLNSPMVSINKMINNLPASEPVDFCVPIDSSHHWLLFFKRGLIAWRIEDTSQNITLKWTVYWVVEISLMIDHLKCRIPFGGFYFLSLKHDKIGLFGILMNRSLILAWFVCFLIVIRLGLKFNFFWN